jgi:hypothetical protein
LYAVAALAEVPKMIGKTQTGSCQPNAITPTRVNVQDLLPEDWQRSVVGVRRKVSKLAEWMVVGWAGDLIAATTRVERD